jgi:hypothetical protein
MIGLHKTNLNGITLDFLRKCNVFYRGYTDGYGNFKMCAVRAVEIPGNKVLYAKIKENTDELEDEIRGAAFSVFATTYSHTLTDAIAKYESLKIRLTTKQMWETLWDATLGTQLQPENLEKIELVMSELE